MTALRLHAFIQRYRAVILVVTALVTAAAAFAARGLQPDSRIDMWFLEGDPGVAVYRDFVRRFGGDETIVVLLRPGDALEPTFLNRLDRVTRDLEHREGVLQIVSLTSAVTVVRTSDGASIEPLLPPRLWTAESQHAAEQRVRTDRFYGELLLPGSGSQTGIIFVLRDLRGELAYKQRLLADIRAALASTMPQVPYHIAGAPVLDDALMHNVARDVVAIGPVAGLAIVIALAWFFRSAAGVLIPLSLVVIALAWTFGAMAVLGWKVNILSAILPPLIGAAGIAEAVHLVAHYQRHRSAGESALDASRDSFAATLLPCTVTAATTVGSLLSLGIIPIAPIRQMGMLAACGTLSAFVLTVFVLPAVLPLLPGRATAGNRHASAGQGNALGALGRRRPRLVLTVGIAVAVACGVAIPRLTLGNTIGSYFRDGDPVLADFAIVDQAFGGTGTIDIVLTAPRSGDGAALLSALADCRRFVSSVPGFGWSRSVLEPLELLSGVTAGDGDRWSARAGAALALIEGNDLAERYITADRSRARMTVQVKLSEWEEVAAQIRRTDRWLSNLPGGIEGHVTGYLRLMADMQTSLLQSQALSFVLALAVVFLLMAVLFRSLTIAVLGMIPNLAPIVATLGVMGWLRRPIDVGTVIVAEVLLGVVVDDTIHYLFYFRASLSRGADLETAVRDAEEVVPAIVATTIILVGGFGSAVFGSFKPSVTFGMLSIVTLLTALLYELTVFPAIIVWLGRWLRPKPTAMTVGYPVVPR